MRVSNKGIGRQMGEMWTDLTNIWKGISISLADGMGVRLKKRVVLVAEAIFFGIVLDKSSLRSLLVFYVHMLIGWMDTNVRPRES